MEAGVGIQSEVKVGVKGWAQGAEGQEEIMRWKNAAPKI